EGVSARSVRSTKYPVRPELVEGFSRCWVGKASTGSARTEGVGVLTSMRPPSAPVLFLLPAPIPARTGFFHAEVELLDVVLLAQAVATVVHHDAAALEHVAVVGHVEGHVGVLLHQQDGGAALAVDADDDLE